MKKIFLVIAAFAAASATQAQTQWGVKAGADFTNYNLSVEGLSLRVNPGTKSGFFVGVVNNAWFCDKVGLQTELMYNYNGTRLALSPEISSALSGAFNEVLSENSDYVTSGKLSVGIGFHTLRLPIMVKFQPAERLSIMAGPYLALRVATGIHLNDNAKKLFGDEDPDFDMSDVKEEAKELLNKGLRRFDIGATMGVEYAFKCGFFVDARYNVSLLNSFKKEVRNPTGGEGIHPTLRYSAIQIGLGFRF